MNLAFNVDPASVLAHDLIADGQAQAGPRSHLLRREHGLEDAGQRLRIDAVTRVSDLHQNGGAAVCRTVSARAGLIPAGGICKVLDGSRFTVRVPQANSEIAAF